MGKIQEVRVPDIGDFEEVDVVEVLVAPGDAVQTEASLITLESDKASLEVPSPWAGVVKDVRVSVGDKVSEGALILTLEVEESVGESVEESVEQGPEEGADSPAGDSPSPPPETAADSPPPPKQASEEERAPPPPGPSKPPVAVTPDVEADAAKPHASPSVRHLARVLGADLGQIQGSGSKGRILKTDVEQFVKTTMQSRSAAGGVSAIPAVPEIDFAKFGPVDEKPLSRIRKLSARNVHRSWLNVPHVTQFDEADITDLEAFRQAQRQEAEKRGVRLTPVAFLMQAAVAALRQFPDFNASLDPSGESLILRRYFHIAIAVDTPDGLVVPVLRDVDKKGLFQLAEELGQVSQRAREGKLTMQDLQGGCFTISSLGGIGGTAFTPIVNAPEVAILGVSRSVMKPVFRDGELVPRLILPLSLSYDHRVIDGAAAVRFTTFLCRQLEDLRRLLL